MSYVREVRACCAFQPRASTCVRPAVLADTVRQLRQVKLKPSKFRNGAVAARAIARMGGFSGGQAVHPGASASPVIEAPVRDGSVSPSDVNLSDMASKLAVAKAAKRGSTPPRVRTPDRTTGRISFASTKGGKVQQLSPPKFSRSVDPSAGAEEVHLPTLTPLARSLATNVAHVRARTSSAASAAANDGRSAEA